MKITQEIYQRAARLPLSQKFEYLSLLEMENLTHEQKKRLAEFERILK